MRDCPCTLLAGANLQAAYPELRRIRLDTPEGLIAGLGYALTRPGHMFQFHQATTEATSARVAQEVHEPLMRTHHPMLCNVKNRNWHIGTGSSVVDFISSLLTNLFVVLNRNHHVIF